MILAQNKRPKISENAAGKGTAETRKEHFHEAHSQKVRSGWLRVVMRRRLAALSAALREVEADGASLWRVAMPPLRRGTISSSELSSSYRFFFILVLFLHERSKGLSVCQIDSHQVKMLRFRLKKKKKVKSDLVNAGRTKPVSLWHLGDFGFQTVHVTTAIAAITQQQAIVIVSLPAHLASLKAKKRC